jgi:hypothetical protein
MKSARANEKWERCVAKLRAGEWEKVRAGIREIEEGRFSSFEELKRDLARRRLANKQANRR